VRTAFTPRVLLGEVLCTFLLCYVVWETAVSKRSKVGQNACIAIGFAVFLAHLIMLPIDGCSINPTRSFGPAVVAAWRACDGHTPGGLKDLWVMWLGPLLGGALAALVQKPFLYETPAGVGADFKIVEVSSRLPAVTGPGV
jgi:glycerol uptake facilitator-like aquaporin